SAEFLEVFVNHTFCAVILELHLRSERRNKARVAVIAGTGKLPAFRIPGDHSLGTSILQHLNAIIGQFKKRGPKSCFAFVISDVDLAEVQDPSARVACHVDLRAGKEDRADGAPIFPAYLERILLSVSFQNVAREILDACT